jgi:hypothetical protein
MAKEDSNPGLLTPWSTLVITEKQNDKAVNSQWLIGDQFGKKYAIFIRIVVGK